MFFRSETAQSKEPKEQSTIATRGDYATVEVGRIVRATEADIELSGEIVTSKVIVNTVKYYYDTEGKMTKKVITPASGSAQTIYYETNDDNTTVKFYAGGRYVTSHSKTDSFGRKVFDELQLGTDFVSRQFVYHAGKVTAEHKTNAKVKSSATTQLVSQIILSNGTTLSYGYDAEERITSIVETYTVDNTPVTNTTLYTYDALGQLLTERLNGHIINSMTYDTYGNISSKNGQTYFYDSTWHDLLTGIESESIEYDAQGNPTKYLSHTLAWEKGRQLKSFDTNTYTYNANGIRTSKTINGVKHEYTLDGTKILKETWEDNTLIPLYDNEDSVCGIIYNDYAYYFLKNLQGDVIAITNNKGKVVASYTYDAWGVCTIVSDNTGIIARVNPFRYRGYYYDQEINLYYLQSRFYDPQVGRFINEDEYGYLNGFKNIIGLNLCCYCLNNAINSTDPFGTWVLSVGVEGQAAFVLGVYAGFAINIDGYWNISITYSIGFAIITNAAAYIQAYIAFYFGKNKVSQLNGWGISVGASFSAGAHVSGGGGLDVGFDGSIGGNVNVGYGVGASAAPVPYFQTRIGYTGTLVSFNLLSILKSWANKKKKRYYILSLCTEVKKYKNYITIYIKPLKKTFYIYKSGQVKIR